MPISIGLSDFAIERGGSTRASETLRQRDVVVLADALEDVERVLDVVVIVPGYLLARTDLELGDPEARALGVTCPALDLVEVAGVLHPFTFDRFHGAPPFCGDGTGRVSVDQGRRRPGVRMAGGSLAARYTIASPSSRGDRQWRRTCSKSSRMASPCSRWIVQTGSMLCP